MQNIYCSCDKAGYFGFLSVCECYLRCLNVKMLNIILNIYIAWNSLGFLDLRTFVFQQMYGAFFFSATLSLKLVSFYFYCIFLRFHSFFFLFYPTWLLTHIYYMSLCITGFQKKCLISMFLIVPSVVSNLLLMYLLRYVFFF